jgi:hypothetical protein
MGLSMNINVFRMYIDWIGSIRNSLTIIKSMNILNNCLLIIFKLLNTPGMPLYSLYSLLNKASFLGASSSFGTAVIPF